MWDLGGMEYFWGPLPILTQSLLLWIFNTTSLLPFRILNSILGSITVYLSYKIGKRFFNRRVGILSALLLTFNPIMIFNNVVGMEETMGIFFVLLALNFYHKNDYIMGVFLGLSSLCRIEFWLLSLGIAFLIVLYERDASSFIISIVGWLTVMVPYFLHVREVTGSPFYAFYWNFIGNIAGIWTPWYVSPTFRILFGVILACSVIGLIILFRYREKLKKTYILYGVFLGFATYHGLVYVIGGTAPLFDRFFMLDVAVGSILLSSISQKTPWPRLSTAALFILTGFLLYSLTPYYTDLQSDIVGLYKVTDELGKRYDGGTVLSNMPMMTYRLVNLWGLSHNEILGTLYIPLNNITQALTWLDYYNASWLIVAEPKSQNMLSVFKQHFPLIWSKLFIKEFEFSGAAIYRINQSLTRELIYGGGKYE
ncbi:MAG: glycosyltransferase family 39 protein [Nitrososphaerota archaeon]